jgi:hypothetical protein
MIIGASNKQILQRMLNELGLDTPGKLRKFVTKTSLPVIGLSLLESALNGVGSWAALMLFNLMPWDAAALVQRGWSPALAAVLLGMGQASTALAAGVLGANCIFSSATFFAAVYASLAFDINARSFLEAVHQRSGGVGIGHSASRAAASIKAVQQLQQLHEMLESRALQRAERGGSRTSLALHLSALADRGVSRGLSLAARGCGVCGTIRFLEGYYLILVTQRRRVGTLAGHAVYAIDDTEVLPLPHSSVRLALTPDEQAAEKCACGSCLGRVFV